MHKQFEALYIRPGVGKVVQRESRLRKTVNTSEPQNRLTSAYNRLSQAFNSYGPFLQEKSYCGPHAFLPN